MTIASKYVFGPLLVIIGKTELFVRIGDKIEFSYPFDAIPEVACAVGGGVAILIGVYLFCHLRFDGTATIDGT